MRKHIILSFMIMFCSIFTIPVMAAPTVELDGQQLIFTDTQPIIEDGRTLVPLRSIFESMGVTVNWNQDTQTVTAVKTGTTVVLPIGLTTLTLNGQVKQLDVPAKIINGHTLVPLRFISEAFGATVNWDSNSQTVTIQTYTGPKFQKVLNNDGSIYEGMTESGVFNGQGTLYWPDGSKYVGNWIYGQRNGQGTYTWPNGDKYLGSWVNDERTGQGTYTWSNGETHVGAWEKGLRHGLGTVYSSDGSRLVGNWINNKLEGAATLYAINGDIVIGEYEDDELIEDSVKIITSNIYDYENSAPVYTRPQVYTGIATPLILVADDDKATFLGELTTNEFDSDSIFNKFGTYGNEFSTKSIWNEFGRYGGEFSRYSPFNEFSLHPPMIIDGDGRVVGYLTVNKYKAGGISPYIIYQVLNDLGI